MGGLATRAVRVGCLALVVGALAGRATVAQPVVETRLLAGVHFIEMLTAGAKTQERLPLVVALHPQRGDAADFIALFQGLRTKARIIAPILMACLPDRSGRRCTAARCHPIGGTFPTVQSVRRGTCGGVGAACMNSGPFRTVGE